MLLRCRSHEPYGGQVVEFVEAVDDPVHGGDADEVHLREGYGGGGGGGGEGGGGRREEGGGGGGGVLEQQVSTLHPPLPSSHLSPPRLLLRLSPPPPSHPLLHHPRPVLVQHLLQVPLPGHALASAAVAGRGPTLLTAEEEPACRRWRVSAEWAAGLQDTSCEGIGQSRAQYEGKR